MKHCTQCGHLLGLGRFCTNCGAPVAPRPDPLSDPIEPAAAAPTSGSSSDWASDTAERPRPPSPAPGTTAPAAPSEPPPLRTPPVVAEAPPPPRFPLFADEVVPAPPPPAPPPAAPLQPVAVLELDEPWDDPQDDTSDDWDDDWEDGRPRWVWAVLALVVLAALVTGAWFLGQQLGDDDDPADDPPASGSAQPGAKDELVDHTAEASAKAPSTAEPGEDVDGDPTSYDASNMLDGVPATTWRTEGDASGMKIVFTFPEKTRITEVGLINGYAKKARDGGKVLDWYEGHRRIQQVTWIFAAGQSLRQNLSESREVQTIEVEPVEVRKVVLKIVATSEPGDGAARRDFTAISDVLLAGS